MHFKQIKWNTTSSNTRIKPILELCISKNVFTWMTLHLLCVQIKKKKDRPTDPPDFEAKRANKSFIFLGLTNLAKNY